MAKVGRPPEPVPQDIADALCEWMHDGKSVASFCRERGIGLRTVYDWRGKDPEFAAQFARARLASADVLVERAQEVADKSTPKNVQCAKLQADILMRRAACYDSRRYGTKVQHGEDPERPFRGMTQSERAQRVRAILSQGAERASKDEPIGANGTGASD